MARRMAQWLRPGGVLYLLDATRRIVPRLREDLVQAFASAGFEARTENYDFASSRLARLLPAWARPILSPASPMTGSCACPVCATSAAAFNLLPANLANCR